MSIFMLKYGDWLKARDDFFMARLVDTAPYITSSSAIAERPRCKQWISFGQKWNTIFCKQYRSIFNHCGGISLQSYRIRQNKAK